MQKSDHDLLVGLAEGVRSFHERYERDEKQKEQFRKELKEEQAQRCVEHKKWTASLQNRIEDLPEQEPFKTAIGQAADYDRMKQRALGAAKIAGTVIGVSAASGGILAKMKHWFGL